MTLVLEGQMSSLIGSVLVEAEGAIARVYLILQAGQAVLVKAVLPHHPWH
jgi:hypothetical protein